MLVTQPSCTYIFRDPKTSKIRYVGKGYLHRPNEHLRDCSDTRLSRMLKKRIREGFEICPIVIPASSDADAIEMEMLLIAMIGREDLNLGPLFNLTDGGDGAANPSIETRLKMGAASRRASLRPETIAKRRASQLIAQNRAETKAKMSATQKIVQNDPVLKARIAKALCKPCTIDGITIYPSRKALRAALGRSSKIEGSPNFRYV